MNLKKTIELVKKIYPLIKPFIKNNLLFILLTEMVVLLGVLIPLIIRFLIDDILSVGAWDRLPEFILLMSAAIISSRVLAIITNILYNTFSANVEAKARESLFSVVIRKNLSFFHRTGDGEIVDRLMRAPVQLHPIPSLYLERLISSGATVIIVFIIIFAIQPALALISLLATPVFLLTYLKTRGVFFGQVRESKMEVGHLSAYYTNTLHNVRYIKNTATESLVEEESNQRNQKLKKLGLKYAITGAFVSNFAHIITQFNQLIILIYGAIQIRNGEMTVGTLVAFYSYIEILYQPMLDRIFEFKQDGRIAEKQ